MKSPASSRREFCKALSAMSAAALGAMSAATILSQASAAQEGEEATVIRKVIDATGGMEAVRKGAICRRTATGKIIDPQGEIPFKEDVLTGGRDRFRFSITLNNTSPVTLALNGDKGWNGTNGTITPLPASRLKETKQESLVMHLATLMPLAEGKFKTKIVGLDSIAGRDAIAMEIQAEGLRPVVFHFDKGKMLLVKRTYETFENGKVIRKEVIHQDFEEFSGLMLPTKEYWNQDGKPFVEISSIKYTFYPKIDDSFFSKP